MFNDDNENLIFLEEDEVVNDNNNKPWRILIVDDENDVHTLTKMVLTGYTFENRPLDIQSVFSGKEAIEFLRYEKDIAIILLDVVMETEDAGLKCVKQIRDELKNHESRIILRTGQPGQAPEQQVIVNYDINDYKAKTELTASKLFTTITTSLRSYQYIRTIQQNKIGLENIIAASSFLFEQQSFSLFAKGILKQLTSILSLDDDSIYMNSLSAFKEPDKHSYSILAGTGNFAGHESERINNVVSDAVYEKLINASNKHESIFTENTYTGYFETTKGEHTLLFLQWQRPLTPIDKDLISIFATNVAAAFENISKNNDIAESQRKIIHTLSEQIESIAQNSTAHIKVITNIADLLAHKMELSESQIFDIKISTPMHDIGQISIPGDILTKSGTLSEEEFELVKKHTTNGFKMFKDSKDPIMLAAGIIAHEHHEKWDGTGYPRGIKAEDIHIYGRIVGLADVFAALTSKRCYRNAWDFDKAINYIKNEKGKHFDPQLVDIMLNSLDEIKIISNRSK